MKEYITLLWRGPTTLNQFVDKLINEIYVIYKSKFPQMSEN
jgi:hypothetical protein